MWCLRTLSKSKLIVSETLLGYSAAKAKAASTEDALWVRMSPGHPSGYRPFC